MTPSEMSYFETGLVVGGITALAVRYIVVCAVEVAMTTWFAWMDSRKN